MSESTPLVGNGGQRNGSNSGSSKTCWDFRFQIVGLVALVGVGIFLYPSGDAATQYETPATVNVAPQEVLDASNPEGQVSPITYRPFCLTHRGKATARILQTSMGNPSQQWAHVPCYSEPANVLDWVSRTPSNVHLNGFGAPDAILQTNLTKSPFANRTPILGFGGAFTEAASLNYQTLSKRGKKKLMELFFGKSGLGYALGRVHINSCDFTIKSYTFDEVDGDFNLHFFDENVTHDSQPDGMIDMILQATSVYNDAWKTTDGMNGTLRMYASPWSPPSWMKNPTWEDKPGAKHASKMTFSTQPSCLREGTSAKSRYAKAWALYFSKFIGAYLAKGVPLWAVTVQNEPEFPAPWEACSYTPKTESEFVGYHLGPQLAADHPDVKIFIFDHNKDHVISWANGILNQTKLSSQYVSGTAYHWYAGGMDRLLDGAVGIPNMHRLQQTLQSLNVSDDHIVLGSESCHCPYTGYAGGDIGIYWARAERYGHTILADLMAGSNGWVEWNLVLDSVGGPNHLGNLCDTSVLAVPHRAINGSEIPPLFAFEKTNASARFGVNNGDSRTREELNALGFPAVHLDDGLAVQPMYYYMGHVSRYVRPGSRAVYGLVKSPKEGLRTFRPAGQVVAGGGMNDLARNGIEVTTWPCEGSTRQVFHMNGKNQLSVSGHDWLGHPTVSCIAAVNDESFGGLVLTECLPELAGSFHVVPTESEGVVKFQQINTPAARTDICLVLRPLKNKGGAYGPSGGAQVALGSCNSTAALWDFEEETGEISSSFLETGEVCMTTGWPFLQIGAFSTPNGESDSTVVLLNEARDAANYVLYDGDDVVLSGSIPPRTIQTVLLDMA
eukprot:Nitzschia sp. Nitz4//scaffold202_size38995//36079//38899//NITZ4_007638-RA/size38995-augustus-gene-0.53-mRNA-1//1//CDS//3329541402//4346//frame0